MQVKGKDGGRRVGRDKAEEVAKLLKVRSCSLGQNERDFYHLLSCSKCLGERDANSDLAFKHESHSQSSKKKNYVKVSR